MAVAKQPGLASFCAERISYHLQACRAGVLRPELPALSVGRAKEEQVHGREVITVAEAHLRVSEKAAVDLPEVVSRVAGGMDEADFHPGVVYQDADQFSRRVPGAADNADSLFHISG